MLTSHRCIIILQCALGAIFGFSLSLFRGPYGILGLGLVIGVLFVNRYLTRQNDRILFKKKGIPIPDRRSDDRIYWLISIPAIVFLFVFDIYSRL